MSAAEIIAATVRAYYDTVLSLEEVNAARQAVRSAEADLRRAQTVREAGMSTDVDVLSIRVHLAGVEEQRIRRSADLDVARAEPEASVMTFYRYLGQQLEESASLAGARAIEQKLRLQKEVAAHDAPPPGGQKGAGRQRRRRHRGHPIAAVDDAVRQPHGGDPPRRFLGGHHDVFLLIPRHHRAVQITQLVGARDEAAFFGEQEIRVAVATAGEFDDLAPPGRRPRQPSVRVVFPLRPAQTQRLQRLPRMSSRNRPRNHFQRRQPVAVRY